MSSVVYFDYTCGYSFRLWRWLEEQVRPSRPDLTVDWSPFSLKEVNRTEEGSYFEDVEEPSLSVLALALSLAAQEANFEAYHSAAFRGFHESTERVSKDDLLEFASKAGVDTGSFWEEQKAWIAAVASGHRTAGEERGVFGTPTLVLVGSAAYLKMAELPASTAEGSGLWETLQTLVVSYPELIEIKRPIPKT